MTPEQRNGIRDRFLASSPSHWRAELTSSGLALLVCGGSGVVHFGIHHQSLPNAYFAAHAHQDIPALLVHIDELQAELDQLRASFKCDMLEDSEALRLAYEKGGDDALRAGKRLAALGDAPDIMIGPGY